MAERIISPGVYARENDQSTIAQGAINLGAIFVGPTQMGPAFVPTIVTSLSDFQAKFGTDTSTTYVPQAVKEYLGASSSVTVLRILGNGGWNFKTADSRKLAALIVTGSGYNNTIVTVLHPSQNQTNGTALELSKSTVSFLGTNNPSGSVSGSFILTVSGSGFTSPTAVTSSLKKTNQDYISKTLGANEFNSKTGSYYTKTTAYPYINFRELTSSTGSITGSLLSMVTSSTDIIFTSSYAEGYDAASTPWITDGNINSPTKLFKFVHLSHGNATNTDVYVSITGLLEPADVNGVEQYSTFSVLVRSVGDSDKSPSIVEQYNNVNLNPDSPNFIARVIGDRYYDYDGSQQKVVTRGNFANSSKKIRVVMADAFSSDLSKSSLSVKASPRGYERIYQSIAGFTGCNMPASTIKTTQVDINGVYSNSIYLGFDFTSPDNYNFLKPIPNTLPFDNQSDFSVNSYSGTTGATWVGSLSASIDVTGAAGPTPSQLQFKVPMQGGSDGINPAIVRKVGTDIAASNVFGYDLSSTSAAGAVAYNKAINILSNQDEYDFNMLVIPGILANLHAAVTNNAINMVETRGDVFYIMDLAGIDTTVAQAANMTSGLNSNYAGTYFPWVKVLDFTNNKPTFVPPSVVVPAAYAKNDLVGAPWFAPAGMGRGGLGTVIEPKIVLSNVDRGVLYDAKINPIAKFPGTGTVIYGQKTLQTSASALDRINVRRLLIELKGFISNVARNLVFEQNTQVTRNRFLNAVNPFLESVQQRQGLYAFRVVMDDSNNTADVIDRNQLIGTITIQPTRTAEFIILDFNILPTGASFS